MRNKAIQFFSLICLVPMLMGFCILPQGILGHVSMEANASMPLKGMSKQKGLPISTMVYVYEAANVDQLIAQKGHYANGIQAKMIKQTVQRWNASRSPLDKALLGQSALIK